MFARYESQDSDQRSGVSLNAAIVLAAPLWFADLTLVPPLAQVAHQIGGKRGRKSVHHDLEFPVVFAPTVPMLTPLAFVIPVLSICGVAARFVALAMLLLVLRYENPGAIDDTLSEVSWRSVPEDVFGRIVIAALVALA